MFPVLLLKLMSDCAKQRFADYLRRPSDGPPYPGIKLFDPGPPSVRSPAVLECVIRRLARDISHSLSPDDFGARSVALDHTRRVCIASV